VFAPNRLNAQRFFPIFLVFRLSPDTVCLMENELLKFIGLSITQQLAVKLILSRELAKEKEELERRKSLLERAKKSSEMTRHCEMFVRTSQERIDEIQEILYSFDVGFSAKVPALANNEAFWLKGEVVARRDDWLAEKNLRKSLDGG
jgi:hypothetical protein